MKIRLMGSQGDLTSASNVDFATCVRVYNSGASDLVLTEKDGSTVVGTCTIKTKTAEVIVKDPAHTLEGGAALLAVKIAHT